MSSYVLAVMTEKCPCNSVMNALLAIKAIRPLHPHLVYSFAAFLGCTTKTELRERGEARDNPFDDQFPPKQLEEMRARARLNVGVGADEKQNMAYVSFHDRIIMITPPTHEYLSEVA